MCEKKTVKPFKTKVNIYRFHFYNLNFCVKGLLTSERKELKESRKFVGQVEGHEMFPKDIDPFYILKKKWCCNKLV